jgi:TP901 family phage tail tape measure protein
MARSVDLVARLVADVSDFRRGMNEATLTAKQGEQKLRSIGRNMETLGRGMTRHVTLPLLAIGAGAVKAFADFDSAMTQSLAIMGDVSDTMRGDMADAAREIGKTTQFSAAQAAESFFFLASAGMDAEQSLAALPQVAAFAQAGMFDMARATDLATDAQSALGLASDDAEQNLKNMARVTDTLVGANILANATVEQFAESLTNNAGAALRVHNKSVEEGVAVLAFFADQGLKGAAAGEALNVVLRDVPRAVARNSDEFERLGLNVMEADGSMRNLADVVGEFERVLGPMSATQRAAALDSLGLTRSVGNSITQLLGGSDAIREYQTSLEGMGGITQQVADKQMESLAAQMGLVKDQFVDAGITIGQQLAPSLLTVSRFTAGAAQAFASLPGPVQTAAIAFGAVLAATGPLLTIGGKLVQNWGSLTRGAKAVAEGVGMSERSMHLFARALPIVAAAAFAATVYKIATAALKVEVDVQRASRALTEDLVQAFLDVQASSIVGGEALDIFQQLAEGNIGTAVRLRDALAEAGQDVAELDEILREAADAQIQLQTDTDSADDALSRFASTAPEAADAAGDLADELDDGATAADEFASALEEMDRALNAMFDPLFKLEDAIIKNEQALWDAAAAEAEFGKGSKEATDANRTLTRSAVGVESAMIGLRKAVVEGDVKMDELVGTLERLVAEGKLSRQAADEHAMALGGLIHNADIANSKSITIPIYVDASQAFEQINRLRLILSDMGGVLGFFGTRLLPSFDDGGVVPGAIGSPQLVLAHGGETVLPTHKPGFDLGTAERAGDHIEIHNHYTGTDSSENSTVRTIRRVQLLLQP